MTMETGGPLDDGGIDAAADPFGLFQEWMKEAENFQKAVTDSVLESALQKLPKQSYDIRHDVLFSKLQSRRDRITLVMDKFYRFLQKRVDIQTSDKNELVQISDTTGRKLNIRIHKLTREGEIKEELMKINSNVKECFIRKN